MSAMAGGDGVALQGFLLAHPMSAEAISVLLLDNEMDEEQPLRITGL